MTTTGWIAVAALGGVAFGAAGTVVMRPSRAPAPASQTSTPTQKVAPPATCPIHYDSNGDPKVDDQKETDHLRQALRDGIFAHPTISEGLNMLFANVK